MANEIKLKRGSGSNPGTSDLVVGEVALRTDNASLFTKKDDGTIAEIGAAAGVSDGDKGDITVSNGGSTFTIANDAVTNAKIADDAVDSDQIANGSIDHVHLATDIIGPENIADGAVRTSEIQDDAVTFAKIQNISTNVFLGRLNAGDGSIEPLSASQTRSILNVENGATADQSASEIVSLLSDQNITTSGTIKSTGNNIIIEGTQPFLTLNDTNNNSDFAIYNSNGNFRVYDSTNEENRLSVLSNGTVDVAGNLDVGAGLDVTGNISCSGTVDGVDIATLNTFVNTINTSVASNTSKLNGIESGATADQTAAEIRTLVESASDSNVFTDADHSKLNGIESGATADQTASEILSLLLTVDGTGSGIIATSAGAVDVGGVTTNSDLQVIFTTNNDGSGRTIACDSTSSKFTYNPSSNTLKVDSIIGALTGNVTGNVSGSSGSCTGNAATASNAALLDSIDSSSFLRSDANDNVGGTLTFVSGSGINLSTNDIYLNARVIQNSSGGTDDGLFIGYGNANGGITRLYGGGATSGGLDVRGSGVNDVKINANTVWHAGNDGSGSGLDADVLDGMQPSVSASNSTIVARHSSGYIFANFFNTTPNTVTSGITQICVETGNDGYIRHGTAAAVRSFLNVEDGATAGGGLPTTGGTLTGTLNARSIIPTANGSYDLGSNSARWRNIYTSDLNMSNEGGSNDIDGSWGSYTIQEGSDDLFLINKRNGKKYKFNLTEIKGS